MEDNKDDLTNVETMDFSLNEKNSVKKESFFAKNKNALIGLGAIFIVIIIISLIISVLFSTIGGKRKVAKDFCKAMTKMDANKMFEYMDLWAFDTFRTLEDDEYEDFWEKYEENLEDLKDKVEDVKLKFKKIEAVEKVGENIWEIEVLIESEDEDGEEEEDFGYIYVSKIRGKYRVVGMK